jgi:transcription elongation factor SPT6
LDLSIKESYLKDFKEREAFTIERRKLPPKKKPKVKINRTIDHPYFKNISILEGKELLRDKEPGELIIRPSSSGYDSLTLTFKYFKNQTINLKIMEKNKKDKFSLGSKLEVNRVEYDDLDEIIYRYVEPYIKFSKTLISNEKYCDSYEDVQKRLESEKSKNPKTYVPYCTSLSDEHPGTFNIYFLPKSKIKREPVIISPKGYIFLKREFKSPNDLFTAFKRYYKGEIGKKSQPSSSSSTTKQSNWD